MNYTTIELIANGVTRSDGMEKRIKIAGAGICCQDYIVMSPQVEWGDTAIVSDYRVQGGGLVGTALVACACLGAECDLYSLLGADAIADQITDELNKEGVSTSGVVKVEGGDSPFSFIHVDDRTGERTIFHRPSSELKWDESFDLCRIAESHALIVDDVYLDLSLAAAIEARAHRVPVVADLMPEDKSRELLRYVDVLIAPRYYASRIGCEADLNAALDAIHESGPATAVITLGADGWVSSDANGRGKGEAFRVDVVDTTGAGDTFHGAFAYGLASGWDTRRCAEFASAVAAIKCTKPGGRTGLPSLEQVIDFLRQRSNMV